jgi:hypothetical protein
LICDWLVFGAVTAPPSRKQSTIIRGILELSWYCSLLAIYEKLSQIKVFAIPSLRKASIETVPKYKDNITIDD